MSERQRIVDVLAPVAVDVAYSYRAPPELNLQPGDVVAMPLGTRTAVGVVWAAREGDGGNLKSVIDRLAWPRVEAPLREFVEWIAKWTLAPRGAVLRMALRGREIVEPRTARMVYSASGKPPAKPTPARAKVLEALAGGALAKGELALKAGVSAGVIDGLVADGALVATASPPDPVAPAPDPDFGPPELEADQKEAAAELAGAVAARTWRPFLLEGVTGSGKTEVYFEAVAAAIRAGRQTLVMMPEIALTGQFLERFERRFGVRPAEWHSGVSPKRRELLFGAVASGEAKVVAGARSALFLPYRDLGLVVVDEEHEGAYKQEDGVIYNARDMAVVRARLENAPVVLASATPSIETRVNAEQGRYGWLRLHARYRARAMPDLAAIDLRRAGPPRGRFLSARLVEAVNETLLAGEQAMLFLNRRGYAPLTLCRACGHRFQCNDCAAWLVEHRFRQVLMCHHCGHTEGKPQRCPVCGEADTLTPCGPGVERIAEEAAHLFPDARRLVLSSDMAFGVEKLRAELEAVSRGEYDLIIGTQLVAKGHDFPGLTLVGVVDADVGLANGDPRAAEHTFQLLRQATGRAGRGEKPGRAFLQTYQAEHPVIAALLSGDVERFYETEIAQRKRGGLPPFGRLAALIVSGEDKGAAEAHARAIARAALTLGGTDVSLLGPAEAPLALLRGRHRFRLAAKAPRSADLQAYLRALLAAAPPARGGIKVTVDVDPQSFL